MKAMSPVSLPGLHTPGVGFEDPFAMLSACHDRVQRSLGLLRRLLEHLQSVGLDDDARSAAHDVWRYFELAAPAHHADEETHVVPHLLASGDPWLAALARRIEADHREMHALWQRLGPLLLQVHTHIGPMPPDLPAALRQQAELFQSIYERHVPLEDRLAFPAVRDRLEPDQIRAMGHEMAQRRNLAPPAELTRSSAQGV